MGFCPSVPFVSKSSLILQDFTKTKEAEANGAFIRIAAENEATAAKLRGEGLAAFRTALTAGLTESAAMLEARGVSAGLLAFTLWTETLLDAAKNSTGNTIFLDGNIATMEQSLRRLQAITNGEAETDLKTP